MPRASAGLMSHVVRAVAIGVLHFSMRTLTMFMILAASGVAATPILQPAQQSGETQTTDENPEPNARRSFKRLVLKDGSYQAVSKYEIKGKIVRYFSSERHEWEDMPYSLVDWSATEKYAEQSASERQVRQTRSEDADAQERAEEDAKSPSVSPGIRLPDTGGVFLLDRFEGKPELNQLRQNGATINKNTGGNILRGAINPIASAKQTIELSGLQARVQAHVADPTIYVALDSGGDPSAAYTPETGKDHFRIVRCEEKKGKRVVGVINIAVYGKVSQNAAYIETKVELLLGSWVRISPAKPLPPGEYALVELLGKQGINTLVWDFGVNASAPANTHVRKEVSVSDSQPPVLQKRKNRSEAALKYQISFANVRSRLKTVDVCVAWSDRFGTSAGAAPCGSSGGGLAGKQGVSEQPRQGSEFLVFVLAVFLGLYR